MHSLCLWAFILEIFGVAFVIWGAFHEARLIRFETEAAQVITARIRPLMAVVRKVVRRK